MADRIPARLSAKEGRKFAYTVGIAFLVLGAFVYWRGHMTPTYIFGALGGTLVVAGTIVPTMMGPVQRAWMGLAHAISKVTTPIFMGVVYFVVLTPVSLFMRVIGKNPLRVPAGNTVWHLRDPDKTRSDLTRQF